MQKHIRLLGGLAVVLASALTTQAVEQSSWGQAKQSVNEEAQAAGKAAVPQAKGTVKPFELAVEALQDVNKVTDVTVTTKVIVSGFSAPTLSKHIQSKSFDTNGELRWTKNEMNVALTPNGGSSTAKFQYSDMLRLQPFQVQEQVQNAQTGNTEVLNAKGIVKLRPDVAVGDLSAPAQANIGQIVNIVAPIKELNGDLGATTNVVLNEGATTRDHADGVSVNPLGNVDVVFAVRFDQAGTYELTVVAQDVVPGDYDNSNNTKSITIQVQAPQNVESVQYSMGYWYTNQDYEYYNYYYGDSYSYKGRNEGAYVELNLPANALTFPVDKVSVQFSADDVLRASLELTNIPVMYTYDYYYWHYEYTQVDAGDGNFVYLQNYSDIWGGSSSYAQFYKYAEDAVFSQHYYDYWGTAYIDITNEVRQTGTFMNATNKVDSRFVVEDDGHSYGGNTSLVGPWTPYTYSYSWDDYWSRGHQYYEQWYGYSSGYTQP